MKEARLRLRDVLEQPEDPREGEQAQLLGAEGGGEPGVECLGATESLPL